MAHWRDGGIGNVAGSDDRPIEEWTLLEKLADVADAPVGSIDRPYVMRLPGNWATPLKALVQEAFDEIVRLRERNDRSTVIDECIEALQKALEQHERSNEGQGLIEAIEVLKSLQSAENGGAA